MKHTIGKTTPYPSMPMNLQFRSPTAGPIRARDAEQAAGRQANTNGCFSASTYEREGREHQRQTEEQVPGQELDGKEQR